MFNPDIDIIIQQPDKIIDGKQTYIDVFSRGRVIDFAQCDLDYFGTIQNGKIILVAPPVIPLLPGRIVAGGIVYDLKSVKICRDLAGNLRGCRCVVV